MPSCDSNIRFVYFRAKGARARVHFPATYFLYFVARFAQTPSLFFVNIIKENTLQAVVSPGRTLRYEGRETTASIRLLL